MIRATFFSLFAVPCAAAAVVAYAYKSLGLAAVAAILAVNAAATLPGLIRKK